ncbi:MAG TPA: hypothetical protein VF480_05515 [Verrucomicrobiae bacterium]
MKLNDLLFVMVFGLLAVLYSALAQTWTQLGPPMNTVWHSVTMSADGKIICAASSGGHPMISLDSGYTWQSSLTSPAARTPLASSADGIKLAGVFSVPPSAGIYVSTNSGNTWTPTSAPNGPGFNWYPLASSADGTKLIAAVVQGFIYVSTNSGSTWNAGGSPSNSWVSVVSSADGTKLAAASGDKVFTSTNSGITWIATAAPSAGWLACNAAGNQLVVSGSATYISTNFGDTWRLASAKAGHVASSADGTKLIIAGISIYTSSDSGVTWVSNSVPGNWYCVASSADGSQLVAANSGNDFSQTGIWIGRRTPSPKLNAATANTNLVLSWIVSSTNFVLQQNLDLSSANWTTISNLPQLNFTNLQEQVRLSPSNSNGFYRLIAQ